MTARKIEEYLEKPNRQLDRVKARKLLEEYGLCGKELMT